MKKTFLTLIISLFCFQSWAQDSLTTRIHNFYQSPRAMGMGNAYSAIADDYAAMFYNPSILVYRKNSEFQINIVSAALATETPTLAKDVQDASNSAANDNDKAVAVSDVLERYYGKPLGARISPLEFIWVSPNWGLSLIMADTTIDLSVHRQVGPLLDLYMIKDTSISYSYAWTLGQESSVGILGKFIHRNEMNGQYSSVDLALDSKIIDFKKTREGMNVDFDIGYTWKPTFGGAKKEVIKEEEKTQAQVQRKSDRSPAQAAAEAATTSDKTKKTVVEAEKTEEKTEAKDKSTEVVAEPTKDVKDTKETPKEVTKEKPKEIDTTTDGIQINTKKIEETETEKTYQPLAISAVLRNVISMGFTKATLVNKDALEVPQNNHRVLDIGASYALYEGSATDIKVAVEAKNLMHSEASFYKCSHIGAELSWHGLDWFKTQFRVGMNQMYFTAGLGLILGPLDLEFATYGEEYGTDAAKVQNRVTAATLALKF